MAGLKGIISEARRRQVFRVAGIYVVAAWVAVQVFSELFPALDVPAEAIRYVWLGAFAGFPLALLFGWNYDLTADGLVRTPPADQAAAHDPGLRRVDYVILLALFVVAVAVVVQLSGRVRAVEEPATGNPLSLAVLPLDNLSGDPEQAYFVAGMHDALILALSRISGLRVTSRTSTQAYANSGKTVPQIGSELGVSKIIEGSVYRVGEQVRIVVQLIDAIEDDHLWTQTYERNIANVLVMQSDITRAIADEVQVALTAEESKQLAAARTVEPEAYEAYLQGKFHAELFTPDNMQRAVGYYQRAVELDPKSPLGYWGLSRICRFRLQAGLVRPRDGEPQCREPLLKAFALDDTLAEVHLGLALGYWLYDYNWQAAEASFLRTLELNPSYAEARMFYSHFLANLRRPEESTREMLLARALDPLNVFVKGLHGAQKVFTGSVEEGVELINESLREEPNLGFGYDVLWFVNVKLGRLDEAYAAARKHFGRTMGQPAIVRAIEEGYATGGYREAMQQGARVATELEQSSYIPALEISLLYEMAGDADNAFFWLNRAYDQHDPTLPYIGAAPMLGNSANDPRYSQLLRRLGLEQWIDDSG